jgi:hypothetical protein
MRRRDALALLAGLGAAAVGCRRRGPVRRDSTVGPGYQVLNAQGEALRRAFNDDLNKVRVLMLVAPS